MEHDLFRKPASTFRIMLSAARDRDLIAVAPARFQAFLGVARVDQRIDQPDAAADQDRGDDEQDDVRPAAVGVALLVVALRIGHASMPPDQEAIVSFTLATSVLSENGLGRNSCCPSGRLLANASSA